MWARSSSIGVREEIKIACIDRVYHIHCDNIMEKKNCLGRGTICYCLSSWSINMLAFIYISGELYIYSKIYMRMSSPPRLLPSCFRPKKNLGRLRAKWYNLLIWMRYQ
jgi:hypothetical protein